VQRIDPASLVRSKRPAMSKVVSEAWVDWASLFDDGEDIMATQANPNFFRVGEVSKEVIGDPYCQ